MKEIMIERDQVNERKRIACSRDSCLFSVDVMGKSLNAASQWPDNTELGKRASFRNSSMDKPNYFKAWI